MVAALPAVPHARSVGPVVYVGRVDRFALPALASVVIGLLLGAAAVFSITLMIKQDERPLLVGGDPGSSVLNRVEYGDRT
jgi:hypothetical protein